MCVQLRDLFQSLESTTRTDDSSERPTPTALTRAAAVAGAQEDQEMEEKAAVGDDDDDVVMLNDVKPQESVRGPVVTQTRSMQRSKTAQPKPGADLLPPLLSCGGPV